MATIIAGDRGFSDYAEFCQLVEETGVDISYVFTCGKQAPNSFARRWAREKNIPEQKYPDNLKNMMINEADDLIYFKRRKSYPDLVKQARRGGLEIYEFEF